MASGSEVHIALEAAEKLEESGVFVRMVSMASRELFDEHPDEYRRKVLPPEITARVAVEAGSTQGWYRYVGSGGKVVGLDHFGASAPYQNLFEKFGITVGDVVRQVMEMPGHAGVPESQKNEPMRVAVGVDHAGFPLKNTIIHFLNSAGYGVLDLGTWSEEPVDYPDYARAVGEAVKRGDAQRGILICGSGIGACVAANKLPGVRAGLVADTYSAHQGVEHDNMNILCLGARVTGPELALELVKAFLSARFTAEERHLRRLAKVAGMETITENE